MAAVAEDGLAGGDGDAGGAPGFKLHPASAKIAIKGKIVSRMSPATIGYPANPLYTNAGLRLTKQGLGAQYGERQ